MGTQQQPFGQFKQTVMGFDPNARFGDFDDMNGFGDASLEKMGGGLTPGDLGENMLQWLKNSSFLTMRGQSGNKVEADIQAEKQVELEEKFLAKQEETEKFVKEQNDSAARFATSQKEIADRTLQEQRDQEAFQDKQKLDAQKYKENEAALKNDMGMFTGLMGFGFFSMFAAPAAINAASAALSPSLKNAGDPMLVTSNNNGALLGAMRNTFGTTPLGLGQDGLVIGNNNVMQFTAGQPLPNAAPTTSPTNTPTLNSPSMLNPMMGGGGATV